MSKSNVIDLRSRIKNNEKETKKVGTKAEVVEITQLRKQIINKERRQKRRTILTEFIGAFIVLPQMGVNQRGGLQKVLLHDISEDGLSFDLETDVGKMREGEEIAMRIYLSSKDYFPFLVKITNIRYESSDEAYRHGAKFVKGSVNQDALYHFIKFIETVTLEMKKDTGDMLTSVKK